MAAWRAGHREMRAAAALTEIKLRTIRMRAAVVAATEELAVRAAIAGTVRSAREVWVALHFPRPWGVLAWVAAAVVVRATIPTTTIGRAVVGPAAASFSFAPEALRERRH